MRYIKRQCERSKIYEKDDRRRWSGTKTYSQTVWRHIAFLSHPAATSFTPSYLVTRFRSPHRTFSLLSKYLIDSGWITSALLLLSVSDVSMHPGALIVSKPCLISYILYNSHCVWAISYALHSAHCAGAMSCALHCIVIIVCEPCHM